MAVHYERGFVGKVKELGLRPATIDIGGGVTFQGGVSQRRQIQLMQLIGELQAEYDTAKLDHIQATEVAKPNQSPTTAPAPTENGQHGDDKAQRPLVTPAAQPAAKKPAKS